MYSYEEYNENRPISKLTSKQILTDEEFIEHLIDTQEINFGVGDIVWFKGENVRKECGNTKFKVLSFEPYYMADRRVNSYLRVNLQCINTDHEVSFLTSRMEKWDPNEFNCENNHPPLNLKVGDWIWSDHFKTANQIRNIHGTLIEFMYREKNGVRHGDLKWVENKHKSMGHSHRYATKSEILNRLDSEFNSFVADYWCSINTNSIFV